MAPDELPRRARRCTCTSARRRPARRRSRPSSPLNRDAFQAATGIHYPESANDKRVLKGKPTAGNGAKIGKLLRAKRRGAVDEAIALAERELDRGEAQLLLSNEGFWSVPDDAMAAFVAGAEGPRRHPLPVLRPPPGAPRGVRLPPGAGQPRLRRRHRRLFRPAGPQVLRRLQAAGAERHRRARPGHRAQVRPQGPGRRRRGRRLPRRLRRPQWARSSIARRRSTPRWTPSTTSTPAPPRPRPRAPARPSG